MPGLSNHAFGNAFDSAETQNPLGAPSAPHGGKGCARERVPTANAHGCFRGGHVKEPEDGMPFELAEFAEREPTDGAMQPCQRNLHLRAGPPDLRMQDTGKK